MLQQKLIRASSVLSLACCVSACGPATKATEPMETARIELGTGLVDFIALSDGGSIELVSGPQGGYHLDLTLRLFDVVPDGVVLDYQVHEHASATRISAPARYVIGEGYVLDRGEYFLRVGDRAILDIDSPMQARNVEVDASCRIERGGVILAEDGKKLTIVDEIDELGP